MTRRISFSGENLSIADAARHHQDADDALRLYFSRASPAYSVRFIGYKDSEVREELRVRLDELDRSSTLSVLAALEAAFRVDYLQRCYRKKKDDLSREFLDIYKKKGSRASLEDDIFAVWKSSTQGHGSLIGDLRGAFRFRHWMAHGRYWTPKLGRKYDYLSVYPLAVRATTVFPLAAP